MTAVDELWGEQRNASARVEEWAPVTRAELDALAASVRRDALMETAREVEQTLGKEYFDPDGKAEEWTMHKRKVWADGAATALGRIRRRAQFPEASDV